METDYINPDVYFKDKIKRTVQVARVGSQTINLEASCILHILLKLQVDHPNYIRDAERPHLAFMLNGEPVKAYDLYKQLPESVDFEDNKYGNVFVIGDKLK